MHKNILNKILIFTFLVYPNILFAYSNDYSNTGDSGSPFFGIIVSIGAIIFFTVVGYERYKIKKVRDMSWRHAERLMAFSAKTDAAWSKTTIIDFTKNVFNAYYSSWAVLDPSNLEKFLTGNFLKKTVLEMSVVKGLRRSFVLNLKKDIDVIVVGAEDIQGDLGDTFTAEIKYDFKMGTFLNPMKMLRDKKRIFTPHIIEYWKFVREESGWQLDKIWSDYFIRPNLLMAGIEENIQKFANDNGFYYDPDFGKIMLPDKGKLFKKYPCSQNVSNHTIGMWDNKILEFYMYYGCDGNDKNRTCRNYVVSQAILPKSYKNMIIESKNSDISLFGNIGSDLEKINTESVDFDKKFSVYRSKDDRVNVLELLPPNFMEHLMGLNFPIYLEIMDNILYISSFYSAGNIGGKSIFGQDKSKVSYADMLKVLCWAFDEMKM